MDSDNQKYLYSADDDEYRKYCDVCDKLAVDRSFINHLKSRTHINIIHIKQYSTNTIFFH